MMWSTLYAEQLQLQIQRHTQTFEGEESAQNFDRVHLQHKAYSAEMSHCSNKEAKPWQFEIEGAPDKRVQRKSSHVNGHNQVE